MTDRKLDVLPSSQPETPTTIDPPNGGNPGGGFTTTPYRPVVQDEAPKAATLVETWRDRAMTARQEAGRTIYGDTHRGVLMDAAGLLNRCADELAAALGASRPLPADRREQP